MTERKTRFIGGAVLLFLLLSVLCGALMFTAVANAGGGERELVLTYDTVKMKSATYTYTLDGIVSEPQNIVSGQTYYIPVGSQYLTIKVKAIDGYTVSHVWDSESVDSLKKDEVAVGLIEATTDLHYSVEFAARDFKVEFMTPAGIGSLAYELDPSVWNSLTYTRGTQTVLPTASLVGYDFTGWEFVCADGSPYSPAQLIEKNPSDGNYYLSADFSLTEDNLSQNKIFVRPCFTPIMEDITRYDYVYTEAEGEGSRLGTTTDEKCVPYDTKIDSILRMSDDPEDGYKSYVGYRLLAWSEAPYSNKTVTGATTIKRYYAPIVYTLVYDSAADTVYDPAGDKPATYTFGVDTHISDPTRRGYTFAGWSVKVTLASGEEYTYSNEEKDLHLGYEQHRTEYVSYDDAHTITLIANWTPNVYNITYDWNTGDIEKDAALAALNDSLPSQFAFAAMSGEELVSISLTDPVRPGYNFTGWTLVTASGNIPVGKAFAFKSDAFAEDLKFIANWEARTYTIVFDRKGGSAEASDPQSVTFDAALTINGTLRLPTLTGFTFDGYWYGDGESAKQYIDKDGNSVCTCWDISDADEEGKITLWAKWNRNSYNVTVNVTKPESAGLTVTIKESDGTTHTYTGTPIALPYETQFTVIITSPDGYKTVVWQSATLTEHKKNFESETLTLGAEDMTLSATVLAEIEVPTPEVDYPNESLTLPEDGKYRVYFGDTVMEVEVNGTAITVNGRGEFAIYLPDSFFGQTIKIVRYGDGTTTADSEPLDLAVAARPAAPDSGKVSVDNRFDNKINVIISENADLYEYAISTEAEGTNLSWKTTSTFEGLNPGTDYYLFIRVGATDTAPHGVVYKAPRVSTQIANYLPDKIKELEDLLNDDDGDIARATIQKAIDDVNALLEDGNPKDSSTFFDDVEGIIAQAKIDLNFARLQDARIAELQAILNKDLDSGAFNNANAAELARLCEAGVKNITLATTIDGVENAFNTAKNDMGEVRISILYNADQTLRAVSENGLDQGSSLALARDEDPAALIKALENAGVTVGGSFMTAEEAEKAVGTLDIVASYHASLITSVSGTDSFTFRLAVPEELRDMSGYTVAYYDVGAGKVEVLETTYEDGYLTFKADRVADFIVLADPVVKMTLAIVALSVVLLCQLIAIVWILITRRKNKGETVNAIALAPLAMTVRFLPAAGLDIVLILGALVVICQIILTWLLFRSDIVFRKKKDPDDGDDLPETDEGETEEESDRAVGNVFDGDPDEEEKFYDDADEVTEESDADENDGDGTEDTDEDDNYYGTAVPEEFTGDEAVGENDDFIEPAANPKYSLEEENLPDNGASFEYGAVEEDSSEEYAEEDIEAEDPEHEKYDYADGDAEEQSDNTDGKQNSDSMYSYDEE